ncbi:RNA polymerase sigma-54 factor [Chlamydia psittaci GR9]|uniref:RNA polymerase factor sigma-54 n=1 Tax=Chlamydophila parapsittaci TaxID=344886 RepID=A0ABX5VX61_9CHLA|nr:MULTISPECIES: RNA polymerase factor sigma-54 [Chlamydia]AFS23262.1 RNA polymerase sigma-54 factor [Chlamydia psittaci VS225]AFS21121.1 RNA polymerase sigma-54 factor [Chlamydia psittaci GR9]AFS26131.1 RNA polymerase sigma-54 factor [Chlamydia psittaci WC]QDE37183.1 RNA polymerase factor sigma-54 [Chlamydophila parapsittaci]QHE18843.1 RNA polymerase factor sigma-54 [Chlamydia psittaci]
MFQHHQKLSLNYLPSLRMQQGLQMLQSPITELSSYILQQIIHNPFFDISSLEEEEWSTCSSFPSVDASYSRPESLFSHLLTQVQQTFDRPEDLLIAQHIIGNLSDQGLFLSSPEELSLQLEVSLEAVNKVWKTIQYFHPLGIASPSLQDYWLLHLEGSPHTLAYKIIKEHYSLLINCDFLRIAKKCHCSPADLRHALKNALTTIPWCPAKGYASSSNIQPALPDVYVAKKDRVWEIQISSKGLPPIKLNSEVFHIYEQLPREEKKTLTQQILSAKWLIKNLRKREQTLFSIVEKILPHQENFLLGKTSCPKPLSVKNLSEELPYHESTIFRAIENKTLAGPIGIIPLKHLFPRPVSTSDSQSKETILQWIHQWVTSETTPLSDADISKRISQQGIQCARRTVAKYRTQLKILPAHKRKVHSQM